MSTKTDGKKKWPGWKRAAVTAVCVLAALAAAVCAVIGAVVRKGMKELEQPGAYLETAVQPFPDGEWLEWDGEQYQYRDGLINILCLGVDGRGKAEESTDIGFGPRADCIILAVIDTEKHTLAFLNISRDSVTPIRWFDSKGQEIGLFDYQLGLQYTMGNGLETSCVMMEEAVSRMLGGIPIHGYCALYWGGVEALQEQTGPVTVEVPEELHELDPEHFPECGEVELTPEQAKIYVQGRDITVTGSNEIRLLRQQEYMQSLYQKIREKLSSNPFSVFSMKEAVQDYLVTDLEQEEILALAGQVAGAAGKEMSLLSVPGESVATNFQDEFHVDQDQLMALIIQLFYSRIG